MYRIRPGLKGVAFVPEWAGGGGWAHRPEWAAVDGDTLVYSPLPPAPTPDDDGATPFETGSGILHRFFDDMEAGDVSRFVMKHGVLELFPGGQYREPLAAWAALYACLKTAWMAGNKRKAAAAFDVEARAAFAAATSFCRVVGCEARVIQKEWSPRAPAFLALTVEALSTAADMRPWVNTDSMHMELHGQRSPVLGQLVLALMAHLADASVMGTCSGCQKLKPLQRRPTPKRRAFCADCHKAGKPLKLAGEEYRARIRSGEKKAPKSLAHLDPHRRPRG